MADEQSSQRHHVPLPTTVLGPNQNRCWLCLLLLCAKCLLAEAVLPRSLLSARVRHGHARGEVLGAQRPYRSVLWLRQCHPRAARRAWPHGHYRRPVWQRRAARATGLRVPHVTFSPSYMLHLAMLHTLYVAQRRSVHGGPAVGCQWCGHIVGGVYGGAAAFVWAWLRSCGLGGATAFMWDLLSYHRTR